jgi:hypothetical protein
MSDKTGKQKAADEKAAKAAKKAESRKEQVSDLSTFKRKDSARWASSAVKKREQNERGRGIVGLKGLGQTTKIKRSRTYKPKKTK